MIVHWDGKLLLGVIKSKQYEQRDTVISYNGKEKLLRIPVTANSLGEEQAIAMHECLEIQCCESSQHCTSNVLQHYNIQHERLRGTSIKLEQTLGKSCYA